MKYPKFKFLKFELFISKPGYESNDNVVVKFMFKNP